MDEKNAPPFGWLVLKRALTDTRAVFESKVKTIVIAILLFAVGLGTHVHKHGIVSLKTNFGQAFLDSIFPVLIVGGFVLLRNLLLATADTLYDRVQTLDVPPPPAPAPTEGPRP